MATTPGSPADALLPGLRTLLYRYLTDKDAWWLGPPPAAADPCGLDDWDWLPPIEPDVKWIKRRQRRRHGR